MPIFLGVFLPKTELHVRNDTLDNLRISCTGQTNALKSGYVTRLHCTSLTFNSVYADDLDDEVKTGGPTYKNLKTCKHFSVSKAGYCRKDCLYKVGTQNKYYDKQLVWRCIENDASNLTLQNAFKFDAEHRVIKYTKIN